MIPDLILAFCAGALGGTAAVVGADHLRNREGNHHPYADDEVLVPDAVYDHFDRVAAEHGQPDMGPLMARKWQALDSARKVVSRRQARRGWRRWTS